MGDNASTLTHGLPESALRGQADLITAVILTHNEEAHIARAIRSLAPLVSRVIVVDSGSSDATCRIAQDLGAEIYQREWVNYADQFQWALGHCAITSAWVMRLDADEWISASLAADLAARIPTLAPAISGISLNRRHYFMGKWIRFGGRYPLRLLRIWRRDHAKIEARWMDEHMTLIHGREIHIPGVFVDENLNSLAFFTQKHNHYATREAVDALIHKYELCDVGSALPSSAQAARMRWLKTSLYNRLPLGVGPALYFLYRYIFQLGFCDGVPGLIYHTLQGFWYRFLVDARTLELDRAIRQLPSKGARLAQLEAVSGLKIAQFYGHGAT